MGVRQHRRFGGSAPAPPVWVASVPRTTSPSASFIGRVGERAGGGTPLRRLLAGGGRREAASAAASRRRAGRLLFQSLSATARRATDVPGMSGGRGSFQECATPPSGSPRNVVVAVAQQPLLDAPVDPPRAERGRRWATLGGSLRGGAEHGDGAGGGAAPSRGWRRGRRRRWLHSGGDGSWLFLGGGDALCWKGNGMQFFLCIHALERNTQD